MKRENEWDYDKKASMEENKREKSEKKEWNEREIYKKSIDI